jgi:hypothetical protein
MSERTRFLGAPKERSFRGKNAWSAELLFPCSMRLERDSPSEPVTSLGRDHIVENRAERKPDPGRLRRFGSIFPSEPATDVNG